MGAERKAAHRIVVVGSVALLMGVAVYEGIRGYQIQEALTSCMVPADLSQNTASKTVAEDFIRKNLRDNPAAKSLMRNVQQSDAVYSCQRRLWPLVSCEGYYGKADDINLFYAIWLNNKLYYITTNGDDVEGGVVSSTLVL